LGSTMLVSMWHPPTVNSRVPYALCRDRRADMASTGWSEGIDKQRGEEQVGYSAEEGERRSRCARRRPRSSGDVVATAGCVVTQLERKTFIKLAIHRYETKH
jgi:hypothetical protein